MTSNIPFCAHSKKKCACWAVMFFMLPPASSSPNILNVLNTNAAHTWGITCYQRVLSRAYTQLHEEHVLLGFTVTHHPHHYSQPVAQETDGMQLQVGAEEGVSAFLSESGAQGLEITSWKGCPKAESHSYRLKYGSSPSTPCHCGFLVLFFYSMSSFFSSYLIESLTFPWSLSLLSVLIMTMLLSRSPLPECSLVELIFGWYYITTPFSSHSSFGF